jgi:transposase
VVLGHEPTGIYHQNWAYALCHRYEGAAKLDYRFLNPLVVKCKRDVLQQGRPRKSDPIDIWAITHCLRDKLGYPAYLPTGAELQLTLWTGQYRQLQRQKRSQEKQLLALVDQVWPGLVAKVRQFEKMHPELEPPVPLVQSKPLQRHSVQAILCHCPNPYDFAALDTAGIQAFLRQHVGRCGPVMAQRARQLVQQALLPPPDVAGLLAPRLQAQAQDYAALLAQLQQLEADVAAFVPATPAAVLTTIPGISPLLAARYSAYLGHHRRFASDAEVWAFAGLDVVTSESGDYRRLGHITRKGPPGLRDTLYLIGLHTARNLPPVTAAYQRALAAGKGKVGAIIHAAHKANRLCFRLLYDQIPFDPAHYR